MLGSEMVAAVSSRLNLALLCNWNKGKGIVAWPPARLTSQGQGARELSQRMTEYLVYMK